jgi:lipopolysaccharide/colanic/teichoic acid biosynthesis glycosyltransferase
MKTRPWVTWILMADLLWMALAFAGSALLRYGFTWSGKNWTAIHNLIPFVVVSGILWTLFSAQTKLDGFRGGWHFPAVVSRAFIAVCALMGVLFASGYAFHEFVSRLALAYFGALFFVGLILIRYCTRLWLQSRYGKGHVSRAIILGSGRVAQELAVKIGRHPEMLCKVAGFLSPQDSLLEDAGSQSVPRFTPLNLSAFGIVEFLHEQRVDQIILALSRPVWPEVLKLMEKCRERGISVSVVPHPYELYLSRPEFVDLDGLPVLCLQEYFTSNLSLRCKRGIDLVLGSAFSLVALPVVLIAAVMLKTKKGRAFAWEKRCGQYGNSFRMLRLNVERGIFQSSLFEYVLEKLSITELPQLWNVMRGEMSLVGPRPETPERVKHYSEWQQQRLSVKPGMTGLAQVHGLREHNSSEEKARFDLQYRLNPTAFGDLSLLLQTTWTLALRVIRYRQMKRELPDPMHVVQPREQPALVEVLYSAHSSQSSAD